MAQLHELALQFQQALEELDGSARSAAAEVKGQVLHKAMVAAYRAAGRGSASAMKSAQPIILRTKLATAIVVYLERLPWASLTPQMLCVSGTAPPTVLEMASNILGLLYNSVSPECHTVETLLLRQVSAPHLLTSRLYNRSPATV